MAALHDVFLAPDGNKPYLYPLSTARGATVTRHFPMETFPGETDDHPHQRRSVLCARRHQRNQFLGHRARLGYPEHGPHEAAEGAGGEGGAKSGTIRTVFDGIDAHGRPIMTETRGIVFYSDPRLRTIDYEIEIRAIRATGVRGYQGGYVRNPSGHLDDRR